MSLPAALQSPPIVRRRRAIVLVCGLAIFVEVAGSGIVIPAIPEFATLFDASDAAVGYAFAAFALAFLLTILPLGLLVDRTGRNGPVVVGGMLSVAAAGVCFGLAGSVWAFAAGQALHGAGSAAVWVAGQPLAARAIGLSGRTGLWFSSFTIAMGGGLVAGPLVGIAGGFRTPFWVFVTASLIVALAAAVVLRGTRAVDHRPAYHHRTVIRNPRVQAASLAVLAVYAAVGAAESLFPLFMDVAGFPKSGIGVLFSLFAACMVVSQPFAGRWIDRVGPRLPTVAGVAAVGVLLGVAVLGESYAVWAPVFTLLGLAVGLPVSASMVMIATGSESAEHGAAYSLWNFSFSIGYLVGPVFAGTVSEIVASSGGGDAGGLRIAFLALAGGVLAAAPAVARLAVAKAEPGLSEDGVR